MLASMLLLTHALITHKYGILIVKFSSRLVMWTTVAPPALSTVSSEHELMSVEVWAACTALHYTNMVAMCTDDHQELGCQEITRSAHKWSHRVRKRAERTNTAVHCRHWSVD